MSENIELKHLNTVNNDHEEYHEIKDTTDWTEHSNHVSRFKQKPIKEYDFFTQSDVKTAKRTGARKKKLRAPDKPSNLMDIITTELSANAPVISENVVSKVDFTVEQQNSFLRRTPLPRSLRMCKLKPPSLDSENGWLYKITHNNLSPMFPNVLENTTAETPIIPVHYVEPIMFHELIQNKGDREALGGTKFLDVTIMNVKFKYHYQFTLETLLSSKLVESYDEYVNNEKYIKDITRDIKVSRETKENLKHELATVSPSKKDELRFDPTVRKYTAKLLKLKEKYFDLLKRRKELIHYLVLLWTDLDMVRHKSENIVTPIILEISKQTLDDEDYKKLWDEIFNVEFSDLLYKLEYDFVTEYLNYKRSKNDENIERAKRKSLIKPKLKLDEDEMKKQVEEIVKDIATNQRYDFMLKKDESVITSSKRVKHAYHIEILVDDIFVCKSEDFFCEVDRAITNIDFTECFSVQILPRNTILTMALFEDDNDVASIKADLSELKININKSKTEFESRQFIYNNIVEPNVVFIGSGHDIKDIAAANNVRLKSSNLFKRNMFTTCNVDIKLEWNEKLNQNSGEAIQDSMELGRQLKRLLHGIEKPNIDHISDIISKLYGQDIDNDENIINMIRDACETRIANEDTFLIDENSQDFVRLKLLHLRNSGGFNNLENKLIPLHATQITTEQLNCLENCNTNEFNIQYYNDMEMDAIELQRFISYKYVEKLNINMMKNLNEYLLKKTHKDVVRDFEDLSLRNIFSSSTSLMHLAAMSSSSKHQLLNDAINKEQEIQVVVYRAFNLFDRSNDLINEDNDDDERIAGFRVRPLRPFVKINYRGANIQTATAIGCHPTWNQTVKIKSRLEPVSVLHINIYDEQKLNITEPYSDDEHSSHSRTVQYRYQNKWLGTLQVPLQSVLTLGTLHGTFKVSTPPMFFGYENITQKKDSNQSLIPEVTQLMRKESAFISLQITTSLSHLGGLQGYHQPVSNNTEDDFLIKHINNFVTNYLNNFPSRNINLTFIDSCGRNKCVTQFLQPILFPEYGVFPKNPKARMESALSKSSGVSKSSSSKSSGRKRDVDVEIASPVTNEESYGTYESWRNGESQLGKMMNACLRYVSLIPTYEVKGSHVVTLVGMELLKVLHGSPLDHTILLASYFLYLGIKCYVAIGLGLPRGLSSYVITKFDLTTRRMVMTSDPVKARGFLSRSDGCVWYVYDATTGERFELRDVGCPLKTVGYVFDEENIWVNVQVSQDCESVSFDLSRSSDWQPVFDKTIYVMKLPIITDTSYYKAPLEVERLRGMLEMKIKAKVQKWRSHMKTIWNRYCSSLLKETLHHWEYWSFNPTENKPGLSQRLKQLMVTYKMFGFPLNMPFVSTKTVTSTVKSTAVYMNDDPNVEFGLSVEVYAYPNNVISVWVFLASITRT